MDKFLVSEITSRKIYADPRIIDEILEIHSATPIPPEKYSAIIQAIESVLNDDEKIVAVIKDEYDSPPFYKLEDIEKAFRESRLAFASSMKSAFDGEYKYPTFEDYKKGVLK